MHSWCHEFMSLMVQLLTKKPSMIRTSRSIIVGDRHEGKTLRPRRIRQLSMLDTHTRTYLKHAKLCTTCNVNTCTPHNTRCVSETPMKEPPMNEPSNEPIFSF